MNDEACVIKVNNTDYYYPCDRKDDIILIDNHLVNVSSSSITLYHEFVVNGDNTTGYPRITLPTNTYGYIRQTYNGNNTLLTVNSAEFITSKFSNNILLLIVLVGVGLCQLFKR